MKYFSLIVLILNLSACGIDKETISLPSTNVTNDGELDTSYNGDGVLSFNSSAGGNNNDEIFAITKDSQNRIIAVGHSINGAGNSDMVVWRLNSDGTLDTTFNGSGIFTHGDAAGGNGIDIGYGVAVNQANEIFVSGTSINGASNFDMVVWKLTASGSLDTSFNGTGIFVHNSAAGGNTHDQGTAIAVGTDGKIVVTGFSDQTATNRDMAIWKLNSNGTLDTTFDTDGIVTVDGTLGGEDENGNGVVIDPSNNIYVVGRADTPANSGDMIVWKYTVTGSLDPGFNGTGVFSQNGAAGGSNFDSAKAVVFDANGSLYITGSSRNAAGNNDMAIWKLLSSGTLDINFATNGYATFDSSAMAGSSSSDIGNSLILDGNGRPVVTGVANQDMAAWRYLTDGTLDSSFNTDGFFSDDSAAGGFQIDTGMGLIEDSIGRLYIGGFSESNSGNNDAVFWRIK